MQTETDEVASPGGAAGRPTMKDVAGRAGVALKTVSRVVNGEPGVTPETASRVLGAIHDLGFRRNESARLLRTGRTATLGFIADTWMNPEHAAVYRGLEDVARKHGYLLYAGSTDSDPEREERLALAMCARRVDGLVVIPAPGSHNYLVSEIEAGVAAVFVLRPPEIARADAVRADVVLPDARGGARAAVSHLAAHGHRRIGFLGGCAEYGSRSLREGYVAAMAAAGLTVEPSWLTLDAGRLAAADPPVTAVFCADQARTRAALRALAVFESTALPGRVPGSGEFPGQAAGPGDPYRPRGRRVAVVGFGDLELADLVSPPVTVVSYNPVLIGHTAGELLIRRMTGDGAPPRRVEVPVRLIARGSAEFAPGAN
ncbi:MAG TPA: LacI family DNA-binding transcriptional regulator [Trebonia sp.]|nr:LacI family DNA-binding transcriptional regulator [Trebonia sp.]